MARQLLLVIFVLKALWAQTLRTQRLWTCTLGEDISIQCFYDRNRFLFYRKYWCHGKSRNNCKELCDTNGMLISSYEGRLTMKDDRRGRLTITMKNLALEDAGSYWFGIDKPFSDEMILVELKVIDVPKIQRHLEDWKIVVKERDEPWKYVYTTVATTQSELAIQEQTRNPHTDYWLICRWIVLIVLFALLMIYMFYRMRNDIKRGMQSLRT